MKLKNLQTQAVYILILWTKAIKSNQELLWIIDPITSKISLDKNQETS
jgi:hypothetical protein